MRGDLVMELGDNIYGHCRSVFNHCDVFGQQSNQIRWKKRNWAITPFKVIQGHRGRFINRKPVCDFLLVINSNWHHISYSLPFRRYRSLLFKFWTLCVFESPFGGLETTYDVHLGLIGKRVVDFLLVLSKLFSLDVTVQVLREKISRKSLQRS